MTRIQLELPHSIHEAVRDLAKRDGITTQQLIATAVAEKIAVLNTIEMIDQRAAQRARGRLGSILDKVSARKPMKGDEIPAALRKKWAKKIAIRRGKSGS